MGDLVLGAEAGYLLASKVRSVIRDDGVGEAEMTHHVLPQGLDNLLSGSWIDLFN